MATWDCWGALKAEDLERLEEVFAADDVGYQANLTQGHQQSDRALQASELSCLLW